MSNKYSIETLLLKPRLLLDLDDTLLNTTEAVFKTYYPKAPPNKIASLTRKNTKWNFTELIPNFSYSVFDSQTFLSNLHINPTFYVLEATIFKYFEVILGTAGNPPNIDYKQSLFPDYPLHVFPNNSMPNKEDFPCDIQVDDNTYCLTSSAPFKILIKNNKDTEYNQNPSDDTYIINDLSELDPILSFYLQHPEFY